MTKPGSHEQALDRFRSGEVKILVGTQMIAKGLDFPNVTLVGVINADTALHFPDFRAAERTFQLVTQVAGRTGRGERGGRVVVQTFSPDHPAILAAQRHDYVMFANQELPVRREFGYPPLLAMVRIVVRGPVEATVEQFAEQVADLLRQEAERAGHRTAHPGARRPLRSRALRGHFRFHILLYHAAARRIAGDRAQAPPSALKPPEDVDLDRRRRSGRYALKLLWLPTRSSRRIRRVGRRGSASCSGSRLPVPVECGRSFRR